MSITELVEKIKKYGEEDEYQSWKVSKLIKELLPLIDSIPSDSVESLREKWNLYDIIVDSYKRMGRFALCVRYHEEIINLMVTLADKFDCRYRANEYIIYDLLKERNYYVDDDCVDIIDIVKKHKLIEEVSLENIVNIVYKSRRSFKHDPVEMTDEYLAVIDEIEEEIFKKRTVFGMGACHEIWALKEEALAKRGISWMSPGMLNPRVMFD